VTTPKDYDVGYGKPPKGSQFKPGKSGNPKGRPKAPPKFEDLLAKEANKTVAVMVNGKKKKLTQAEVVIKALMQKAMKGDIASARVVVTGLLAYPHDQEGEAPITAHELALLLRLLAKKDSEPPEQDS
jgi:hypothetical protein